MLRDMEMALQTLIDETQAIKDYKFRIAQTKDEDLKKVLIHLIKEEKEHVSLVLSYLKKRDKTIAKQLDEHVCGENL